MRLTREQILKMAGAVTSNGEQDVYEIGLDERGGVRLWAVELVEKKRPVSLGKVKG